MCRLILASGDFAVADITAAALDMSCGRTAAHDNPTKVHAHGWGAVWREHEQGPGHGLRAHTDVRPMADSLHESLLPEVKTDFLAIHTRNASLESQRGLDFTHPLSRDDGWYFMHNGYLPTAYQGLGLPASAFDSREYFDYLVPRDADGLDPAAALGKLDALAPGGNSGNAIAVHPAGAYLVHWSAPSVATPVFFAMQRLSLPGLEVIASEVVPGLAPARLWEPVAAGTVSYFPFPKES
ncbi:class II glutamine amidotransferase [Streptomyces sp. NBC_01294]|uniref:class II glutamine amidotransferase n=1 Tax=Streptomyces sp. NBC_01294 TaxID=2903815 RepID=UPI002DDC8EB8|nr:class II glutamine amidotransferase [Streptomyces sp. NBC_01294]WRZ56694.1 class II glutamine amidotransferase [Streptomyces sp. NBC_01294]